MVTEGWLIKASIALIVLSDCATPTRLDPVPQALTENAAVLGLPNARFWADTQGPQMVQEAKDALARE